MIRKWLKLVLIAALVCPAAAQASSAQASSAQAAGAGTVPPSAAAGTAGQTSAEPIVGLSGEDLTALAASPSPAPPASASPSPAPTTIPGATDSTGPLSIRETRFLTTEVSLTGSLPTRQDYFNLPTYWRTDSVTLALDYQFTQLALTESASLTVSINGHPVYSFRPTATSPGKQRLTLNIPRELLVAGDNLLRLQGSLRTQTNEEVCLDEQASPAEWVHLYSTSSLKIAYREAAPEGTIRDFYKRLTGFDKLEATRSLVMIPAAARAEEWAAALYALAGFARSDTRADKAIPLVAYAAGKAASVDNAVLIALYDDLPAEWRSQVSAEGLDHAARLQLVRQGASSVLVVTSRSDERLIQAGRFLANPQLMSETAAASVTVDAQTKVETPAVEEGRLVALTSQGDKVVGSGHQELAYYIPLSAGRALADSGKLQLYFRYAANLDFDRSMVSVLINGTPISSKKLTADLASGDKATFAIPKNLKVTGNLTFTVAFDLELKGSSCIKSQQQMPWAYVSSDSMLQLNTRENTERLFNNYPYPFLRDGVFNQVGLVLPEERPAAVFEAVSSLVHLLGRNSEGNSGELAVFGPDAPQLALADRNLIVIGTYRDNPVIRFTNEKLYFRFSGDGKRIEPNEKLSIEAGYGQTVGTLQLLDSPFGPGKAMLAVTGPTPDSYRLAAALLGSDQKRWRIWGDGVLTDKDGTVQAFRFQQETGGEAPSVVQQILGRPDQLAFALSLVTVAVLVLVALLLLIRKHGKKRRG
jgi:hypothetical protein